MCEEMPENKRKLFKIFIRMQDGGWVDVSEKRVVIYGAGQGCINIMNEIQLPSVYCVVDSDKNKWNQEIELLNTIYKIQPPSILSSLELDKYYIVISSDKYAEEIKNSIEHFVGKGSTLICEKQSIYYCYERLEDMFWHDPLMRKGILTVNMSFELNNVILLFKEVVTKFDDMVIDRYMPSKGGESKLSFLFGNASELWVFSVPGLHNDWEKIGIERDRIKNRVIRYELKKRIGLDREITVYENSKGVLIQKYAGGQIDFSSNKVKEIVLDKCRILHETEGVIDIKNDMICRHYEDLMEKGIKAYGGQDRKIKEIKQVMKRPLTLLKGIKYVPRICHCDLFCSNVVCHQGEIYFIDWEYMAMSDPMFDVCGFLFSSGLELYKNHIVSYVEAVQEIYALLKKNLVVYFKRDCTEEEYLHAFLVMLIFECRELLGEYQYRGNIDSKRLEFFLNRISAQQGLVF